MNWGVAHVVFLKQLGKEDGLVEQLLESLQGVMLGTDVEDRLMLVVTKLEVLTRAMEVLLKHGYIVVDKSVV